MEEIDLLLVLAQIGGAVAGLFVGSLILMLVGCSTAFILVVTSFLDAPARKDMSAR